MKLVTKDHIERWAETTFSKGDLPYLMSRLVRATTPVETWVNFPSGSATYIGGWDGEVNCPGATAYIPKGISLFEFGTESNSKGKADDDYDKRKANTLGYDPKECVFIFITARFWKLKDKWIATKKAEGFWKDVKVYDSSTLEQWLDQALAVSRWFSAQPGIEAYPFDGIMTADEFWDEWSAGPDNLKLLPEVITSGREYQQQQLLTVLKGKATVTGIRASSKNEAVAFIVAAAKQFPVDESEKFFSKSLVVDTEGNFRGMKINATTPLNLIPRFDETQPLLHAASKGHHILVPLGADDDINSEPIILPTINRDGQIKSLIKSGILEENAERFSRESGRNITLLKKLLGFPHTKAKWFEKENILEIIPALLLGRWNETFSGDLELIEKLSGQKYTDYLATLNKWKKFEESPLLQIGETWRLTSPLDLWTNLAQLITQKDFQNLNECFTLAFKSGNPVIEPKDKEDFFALYSKPRKYSSWSREGLTQSLILIGRLGEGLSMPSLPDPQIWVDTIISDLLSKATGEVWTSVDHELPLISEASPTSFLKAVDSSLSKDHPEIKEMFIEEDGLLHKTSHHTGLLWALEGLAWLPEYLRESTLALLRLAQIDPGGSLNNRPINSICEIFKPWHYQTLVSYEERMEILKYITGKEKEAGWTLLIRMLPDNHGIAHPTHKMRWRMFDKNTNLTYTYQEIWKTHSYVVELLLHMFDNSEQKFSQIINETSNLSPDDRKRVLDWADSTYVKVRQKEFITWETIRKILNHHRSYPDTDWALPESELARLEILYHKLQPPDLINRYAWLFNDPWPALIEGFQDKDDKYEKRYEQQENKILQARNEAISLFLKEVGLEKTLELRKQIKEIWAFGDTLARVITKPEDILIISECLNDSIEYQRFVQGFFFRKSILEGVEWIKSIATSLQEKGLSSKALSNLLVSLEDSKQLWDFISTLDSEIQTDYWQNVHPRFYHIPTVEKIIGLKKLMEYKRYFSAIDITSHIAEEIPTDLLTDLLKKAATEKASEDARFKGYEIERIFESLDRRTDVENSIFIHLEWLYLPLFDSYGTKRNPKHLEDELAKSPEFFIEVLKWVYAPKEKERIEEERKGISDKEIQNRAKQAYHLLHSWKKIPGMKEDNSIDEAELMAWVRRARELANEASRIDVADMQIGQVLAQYPENTPQWPQEKIFQVIEEINTDSLKRNYSAAMFNKRSFSSRAAFEGGDIERDKASYFKKLADDFKHKYPNVAEIFRKMEQGYIADAKRMDESAERDRLEY